MNKELKKVRMLSYIYKYKGYTPPWRHGTIAALSVGFGGKAGLNLNPGSMLYWMGDLSFSIWITLSIRLGLVTPIFQDYHEAEKRCSLLCALHGTCMVLRMTLEGASPKLHGKGALCGEPWRL